MARMKKEKKKKVSLVALQFWRSIKYRTHFFLLCVFFLLTFFFLSFFYISIFPLSLPLLASFFPFSRLRQTIYNRIILKYDIIMCFSSKQAVAADRKATVVIIIKKTFFFFLSFFSLCVSSRDLYI